MYLSMCTQLFVKSVWSQTKKFIMLLTILYVVFAQCNAIYGTIYGKKQVNSYKLLGTSNIDGEQSHTFYAKSLIECGAFCRAKKNCNSFVYNNLSKDCKTYRLWTNTTDNTTGNIMDIYAKETKYRGNFDGFTLRFQSLVLNLRVEAPVEVPLFI